MELITNVFASFFKLCVMSEALVKVVHLLFVLNSAFNPIVYAVMKKDFKRELKKYRRSDNFKKNGKHC